ncbi:MAG: hypothetical protein ACRD50_05375 [Candidatus Acidiferrales bacterium]
MAQPAPAPQVDQIKIIDNNGSYAPSPSDSSVPNGGTVEFICVQSMLPLRILTFKGTPPNLTPDNIFGGETGRFITLTQTISSFTVSLQDCDTTILPTTNGAQTGRIKIGSGGLPKRHDE